jgi:MarR family transcriptional regulator for hemolysin
LGDHRDEVQFLVAFKVVLVSRLWRARFAERLNNHEHTDARWTALYMIADASRGIIQTHLAERLGVQGPTLVRLLEALEHQGLIARDMAPDDRRAKVISIKGKGLEVLAEMDKTAAAFRAELFTGVSEAELETTLRVLRHLSRKLEPQSHQACRASAGSV